MRLLPLSAKDVTTWAGANRGHSPRPSRSHPIPSLPRSLLGCLAAAPTFLSSQLFSPFPFLSSPFFHSPSHLLALYLLSPFPFPLFPPFSLSPLPASSRLSSTCPEWSARARRTKSFTTSGRARDIPSALGAAIREKCDDMPCRG